MTDSDRDPISPRDAASYIADLVHELAGLAGDNKLEVLRYLLEMARDEARMAAFRHPAPATEDSVK